MSAVDALPEFHHRERHSIRVAASPERWLAAARETRLHDVPLLRLLVVRPFSGLVRRSWLKAARRRAESA